MKLSRRDFVGVAGIATLGSLVAHGCAAPRPLSLPSVQQQAKTLETTTVRLGFVPMVDAAPLIIAQAKGLFDRHGIVDAQLVRHESWTAIRTNLELEADAGGLNGAHLPTSLPYLMSRVRKGDGGQTPMYILARLNLNGQSIALANIYRNLKLQLDSSALKESVERAKAAGSGLRLKFGIPFPGGTHDLWLRYWLAAGDINPETDVSIVAVPPAHMVANMQDGTLHALCVGEPWSSQLVRKNIGYTTLTTGELWSDHPESSFAVRANWVDRHPKTTKAILMAVQEAQIWCDQPANRQELRQILSQGEYLSASRQDLLAAHDRLEDNRSEDNRSEDNRLQGSRLGGNRSSSASTHALKFWINHASYPYKSHDRWFLTESIRWGFMPPNIDLNLFVDRVNREDLWRAAATAIGHAESIPVSTSRGVEVFFDGREFNPQASQAYLKEQPIKTQGS